MLARLRAFAAALRDDVVALWFAGRDPRVPLWIKALAALTAAYALSPLDLVPDFIPVLGYLDELVLLPLAVAGLVKLIDPAIMAENRAAARALAQKPVSRSGLLVVVAVWVMVAALLLWLFWPGPAG